MDDIILEGSTGQLYYPLTRVFNKKVGQTPTFTLSLPEDDLERVVAEDYFTLRQNGVTKFKGIPVKPITFDLSNATMEIVLDDYLYVLYRDYDLVSPYVFGAGYRYEHVNENVLDLTYGIVNDLLYVSIGEPYWQWQFGVDYAPPVKQTIRYEFENRTNALIRLAQACKYGRDFAGTLYTDPDHILTEDGVCDLWLDYDGAITYPYYDPSLFGNITIGILGARRTGTDLWEWITNDITNDVYLESLSELQYAITPPSTVFVVGAGDGLNQVVGKATKPVSTDFSDIVRYEDKLTGGLWYLAQWNRPTVGTVTAWTREDAGGGDYYLKAFEGTEADHYGCLRVNKGQVFNSPTIKAQFQCESVKVGCGVYVEGRLVTGVPNYWYLLLTFTSTTAAHYKWMQRWNSGGIAVDRIVCEGDIALTTGAYHDLEFYCDMWENQVYCAIDGNEIFWMTGYDAFTFHSGTGDREVGLVAYFTNSGSSAADFVRFRKISVHDNKNIAPVQVESDAKYLNCLAAYKRAEKILSEANASRNFSINCDPTIFIDGKIDVGQRAIITTPAVIAGTYRIMEINCTEEACTLALSEVA
ncbi:MAG: hypothetical protein Q8R70_09320 [Methanoregula sp.]|nr:hypothetical protein [Methanoregula sp.]